MTSSGLGQRRLCELNFDKPHRYHGDSGGMGIGYGSPASVGAALANKGRGRLSIGIVADGDLNFGPGVLWTAMHHKIPLLFKTPSTPAHSASAHRWKHFATERPLPSTSRPHDACRRFRSTTSGVKT